MTPTEQAARWLADVRPHKEQLDVWADELIADLAMRGGFDVQDYEEKLAALSDIREKLELSADHCRDNALAAIARHLAPGDDWDAQDAAWCERVAAITDEAATLRARLARMEAALQDIAKQKKTTELDTEYDVECADFEGGYDAIIEVARAALPASEEPE